MSFVRKEDGPKAAKLIGAVVVVFGCAAWRVVGAVSPAAPPAPDVPATVAATPDATSTTAEAAKDDAIQLPRLFASSDANPFRTIAAVRSAAPMPPTLAGTPVGPISVAPLTVGRLPTSTIPVPALPSLRVTGIVAGSNATAVVEFGSEARVVRVGARLADGTVVLRIDPATVTVRRGGKTQTLDVGE